MTIWSIEMASYSWIKLYQEMLRDPKVGRLSDSAFRRYIELLLLAGEQPARDGRLPEPDDIAWALRIARSQLEADLAELDKAGLVANENGRLLITNFTSRQAAASTAERVKLYRKRQKQAEYQAAETAGNGRSNGKVNGTVTKRYPDRDKELDGDGEADSPGAVAPRKGSPPSLPVHLATDEMMTAWGEWLDYHEERGKPLTKSTALKQFKQFERWGVDRSVQAMANSIANGYVGLVEPKRVQQNGQHHPAEPAGFAAVRNILEEVGYG
jgi:hypothetical protein